MTIAIHVSKSTEALYFFRLSSELFAAMRTGDALAIAEARDEMEVFAMYVNNPLVLARAQRALAPA